MPQAPDSRIPASGEAPGLPAPANARKKAQGPLRFVKSRLGGNALAAETRGVLPWPSYNYQRAGLIIAIVAGVILVSEPLPLGLVGAALLVVSILSAVLTRGLSRARTAALPVRLAAGASVSSGLILGAAAAAVILFYVLIVVVVIAVIVLLLQAAFGG